MTDRYMADNVETYDGRRTEGDATGMKKSSCCDSKHTVPELVASFPQVVSLINPSEEQEEEHGHPILKSPVTINSRSVPNSMLELLIPVKVNCSESFHISGRRVHLRLGTFVWAALRGTSQSSATLLVFTSLAVMVTNFFAIIKTLFYFDCSLGHGRS